MLLPEEELIAGRRPVEEAFVAGRTAHRLLVVPQRRQALERLVLHATNLRIPILEVEGGTLTALAGFDGHQGIAIAVEARRYATLEDILARAIERGEPPFVLALDSLEDPQNVGTLLRSAEAAGVHGVLFPTHRQAPLTPAAVKASAGAVEHLLLAPVDDLAGALADLHVRGLRVAGAEADAPLTARQADLRGPLAIVVGSEGQGLGPAVRKRTDLLMRIPMRGQIDSLNAAVAGSILVFEALAQRDPEGTATRPPRPSLAGLPGAPTGEGAALDVESQVEAPDAPTTAPPAAPKRKARAAPTAARQAAPIATEGAAAEAQVADRESATKRPRRAKAPAEDGRPDTTARPKRSAKARSAEAAGAEAPGGTAAAREADGEAEDLLPGGPAPDGEPTAASADAAPDAPTPRKRRSTRTDPA